MEIKHISRGTVHRQQLIVPVITANLHAASYTLSHYCRITGYDISGYHHHHFICSKTKDASMQTKDMDVEQDTPGSDKLLRWPLKKRIW